MVLPPVLTHIAGTGQQTSEYQKLTSFCGFTVAENIADHLEKIKKNENSYLSVSMPLDTEMWISHEAARAQNVSEDHTALSVSLPESDRISCLFQAFVNHTFDGCPLGRLTGQSVPQQ